MKAIARFVALLLLICGTTLVWKTTDRRFRHFSAGDEANRPKEEGDPVQSVLPSSARSRSVEPAWSKAEFQGKLEDAFQKNDPCAVMELLRNTRDAAPRDFWSAGMTVLLAQGKEKTAGTALEELLAFPDSPLYGLPKDGSKRVETRFFNALIYSGQLKGIDEADDSPRRHGNRNFDKSIEIFKELATEDAENGAHSYFLASALRQSGAKKEEVRGALNQSVKVGKFDPFYQSIYDTLTAIGYTNAATFTFVHSFLEIMPMPDYEIGIRYLKYWAHEEETGKWIAHRFAKRLIDLGSKYKTHSPGYQFSRAEYLLGQNLKFTVEGKMEKSWEDYMNRMREAQNFISESPRPVVDAEINIYREKIEGKKTCGPDAWKTLFTAYRSKKES